MVSKRRYFKACEDSENNNASWRRSFVVDVGSTVLVNLPQPVGVCGKLYWSWMGYYKVVRGFVDDPDVYLVCNEIDSNKMKSAQECDTRCRRTGKKWHVWRKRRKSGDYQRTEPTVSRDSCRGFIQIGLEQIVTRLSTKGHYWLSSECRRKIFEKISKWKTYQLVEKMFKERREGIENFSLLLLCCWIYNAYRQIGQRYAVGFAEYFAG